MRTRDNARSPMALQFLLFAAASFFAVPESNVLAADQPIDNHHVSCIMCHRTSTPEYYADAMKAGDLDMSAVCMDCHHYSENHHPVNIVPKKTIPDGFPLYDGRMKCLTCHEAHGNQKRAYPKLLRGAPYKELRDMCFACHPTDQYTDLDPHQMLNADGTIRQVNGGPVCLVCHTKVPDHSKPKEQITFKADVAFLCWRCHPPMPDNFFAGHFLVTPSRKTSRYMKKYGKENNATLPLLNRNRITCSTCHNPHQSGVIENAAVAAGADSRGRLRLSKSTICSGCHPY